MNCELAIESRVLKSNFRRLMPLCFQIVGQQIDLLAAGTKTVVEFQGHPGDIEVFLVEWFNCLEVSLVR